MRVNQAFRFELDPNRSQRASLAKHVGAARFAYNWGLSRSLEALERGERIPTAAELHRQWNVWKRANAPWWAEVSKCAPQEAFRDLERAFRNWRERRAKRPRFKRKKNFEDNRARLTGSIRVFPRHVQLPRMGKVRTKEQTDRLLVLLETGKARILSATVSPEADQWFASLTCEVERPDPEPRQGEPVGVDLGLDCFAVLSDGTRIEAPRPLKKSLKLLRRRSRQLSRKQKESKNHAKAVLKLARLHRRIRNIRRDFLHKITTWLAKTKPAIVVEDLSVRGLMGGRQSRSVADVGWGTFRRMLEYKSSWYGARLITAPRSFPSTRSCSRCGALGPKLSLSQRMFRCSACQFEADRDFNAALNLRFYGLAAAAPFGGARRAGCGPTGSSPGSYACGDPSGGGTGRSGIAPVYEPRVDEAGSDRSSMTPARVK
jgi:putative transposase